MMTKRSISAVARRAIVRTAPALLAAALLVACAAAPAAVPTPAPAAAASTPVAIVLNPAATAKLNLNTATAEQFRTIPGVGDRMVREFEEYRPYTSILQFRREIGKYVSANQVTAYEQYVFVPVDPNAADADTLRQLPGVDAAIAAQLIASRPYASADAFLAKLGQVLPAAQLTAVRGYLAVA